MQVFTAVIISFSAPSGQTADANLNSKEPVIKMVDNYQGNLKLWIVLSALNRSRLLCPLIRIPDNTANLQ